MPTLKSTDRDVGNDEGVEVAGAPLGSLLLQVIRRHRRVGEQLLREVGLIPPQELVLMHLDRVGPSPQSDLVRYLGRDRSTVTATLQAMGRLGLVAREPSPDDRRAVMVSLSDKGTQLAGVAQASWVRLESLTFGELSAAERRQLSRALVKVRDSLGAELGEQDE